MPGPISELPISELPISELTDAQRQARLNELLLERQKINPEIGEAAVGAAMSSSVSSASLYTFFTIGNIFLVDDAARRISMLIFWNSLSDALQASIRVIRRLFGLRALDDDISQLRQELAATAPSTPPAVVGQGTDSPSVSPAVVNMPPSEPTSPGVHSNARCSTGSEFLVLDDADSTSVCRLRSSSRSR